MAGFERGDASQPFDMSGLSAATAHCRNRQADHVFKALMQLVQATQVAMLIATHNMELAGRMDRRVSLVDGQVVELE